MKKYVDVILPLPLPRSFTYSLSDDSAEDIEPGCRVVVPFGRKKFYTAIVCNVHYYAPAEYEVKEISDVSALFEKFMALYYCRFSLSFGNGWPIIIFVRKEMFTRLRYLPG